jgi:hypothetical protein
MNLLVALDVPKTTLQPGFAFLLREGLVPAGDFRAIEDPGRLA